MVILVLACPEKVDASSWEIGEARIARASGGERRCRGAAEARRSRRLGRAKGMRARRLLAAAQKHVGHGHGDASKPDDATAGGLLRDQAGFATVDEVVRWAERRFGPEPFKDLPKKKGRVIDVSLCEQVNTSTALSEEAMPGDLGRLRDLVRHLRGEIARLTQEKAEAEVMRRRELGSRFHKK